MPDDDSKVIDPRLPASAPQQSFIGKTLGHYQIVEKLGEGGMGVVFKALDSHLERFVALKTLRSGLAENDERKKRFALEAKSASALNHPSIIHIYDIGKANDVDFIAMEYVQGKTLDQLIGPKGLPSRDALKYAIQVADALDAAHGAGIVHRDLKPGNVMVTERGVVKVLDFGLAKLTERASAPDPLYPDRTVSLHLTQTMEGTLVGSPAYMSPEQAEGAPLDARSDIFSFGLVLYEMATGKRAFQGDSTVSVLTQILRDEPAPPTSVSGQVPVELERVILRCLRKDPKRRYQHMSEVRIALEDLRDESISGVAVARAAVRGRARRWSRGRVFALGAALLVILAGAGWWFHRSRTAAKLSTVEPVLSRLTLDPGLTTTPSISWDGKLLAYASDRAGKGSLDIWVRQIGGAQPIQLTTDPADDSEPDFSPDGTRIAFHSERAGGGLYLIPSLGGTEQRIADGGRRPRFSPDGSQIAYWIGVPKIKARASFAQVCVISSKGGVPRIIQPDFTARWPVWTPDGQHLLFLGTKTPDVLSSYAWWITSLGGSAPRKTGIPVNADTNSREPITFRGDDIVYSWHETDGSAGLRQLSFSQNAGSASGEPRRLTFGTSVESLPSAAADGRLVFASLAVNRNLYAVPLRGDVSTDEQPKLLSADLSQKSSPSLSADGKALVYMRDSSSGVADVWFRDMQTGKERPLTNPGTVHGSARMSPDGGQVVYNEIVGDKACILELSTKGGVTRQICENCGLPQIWFPDGRKIMTGDYTKKTTVDVVDIASGQKVEYLRHPKYSLLPRAVSPNGRWIAFTADVGGGRTPIFIAAFLPEAPPPEKEWIQVTDGSASDGMPQWSLDGNLLYFSSERDGSLCLWGQRLDARTQRPIGAPFPVHHFHGASLRMERPMAVARDKIVLQLEQQTGNIWMLEPGSRAAGAGSK